MAKGVTQLLKTPRGEEEHSAAWTRRALEYFLPVSPSLTPPSLKPPSVFLRLRCSCPPPKPPSGFCLSTPGTSLSWLPEVRAKITRLGNELQVGPWTSGTSCGALQQELSRKLISSTASSWLDSPGASASDAHFLGIPPRGKGLMRWNQDRWRKGVGGNSELRTYRSAEREAMGPDSAVRS
ncbi:hypothetical protein CRENBAI_007034 [Crenichthys baileyi]|uniref:Uncharacterized protein n=1 Tax=Crenichthys baileyi TaxID=28760 RepID=A0AAV9RU72_9TELE